MKSDKYVNEILNITTLTPIFIGDDQASVLSPVTDFIVNSDEAIVINQKKLENLLNEDLDILNEYVDAVKAGTFDLENFINEKLNTNIEELIATKITVEGYLGRNEVKNFISSVGKPFLPGSTIKGAIRTAIIYNWLSLSSEGNQIVRKALNMIDEIKDFQKIIKLKSKKYLDKDEKQELRKIDRSNRLFNNIYNELYLFKDNKFGHDFRHLQISDSQLLEFENTKIIQLFRKYLTQDKTKTQPWAQVLSQNTTTKVNVKIEKDFKDPFLQKLNSDSYKEVFKMVNKFSLDIIDFELDRFDDFIRNAKKDKDKIQEKLTGIIGYYKELKEKIKFSRDNCAVIRIGGGKTYFDNSIGLALYKADKEKFKQFRKLLGFWKHRSGNRGFVEEDSPITRTFYNDKNTGEQLPLGWTVIYFEKDKEDVTKIFDLNKNDLLKIRKTETDDKSSVSDEELDLTKLNALGRVTHTKKK